MTKTPLEDAIKEALSEEEAAFLEEFDREPSTIAQVGGLFRGQTAPLNIFLLVFAVIVGGFGVYTTIQFVFAEEVRALFHWGALTALAVLIITVVRLFFFMELHSNRVIREVKRLELQVAYLAARDKR